MAEIRLNKLIKKYNIGLSELVDFLRKQGAEVDESPNAKVSDEYVEKLDKQFGKDLEMAAEAAKLEIKLTNIIEKNNSSKAVREEEEEAEETISYKDNSLSGKKLAPAPAAEPEPAVSEQPAAEPVLAEEPAAAEQPVAESADTEPAATEPERAEEAAPADEPDYEEPQESAPEQPDARQALADEPAAAQEAASEPEIAADEPESVVEAAPADEPKAEESQSAQSAGGLKVFGKIDLSQFDRKPKKRERINKNSQKVDVAKVGANIDKKQAKKDRPAQQNGNASQQHPQNQPNQGKGRNKRDRDRFKPALTEAEQDELQKEIQKQVKETYAKMNEGKKNNFGAKYRKEKREAAALRNQEEMMEAAAEQKVLKVTEFVTVNDLATLMNNTPVVKVIGACMSLGLMVSINQRLDAETLVLVAEEFGYKVEFVTAEISEEFTGVQEDKPEDLQPRPPIITVMGHVDHGKTSLLDYIRKSNVIAGEAGGITQHIGAYNVKLPDGRHITFLDTPGHEAFTAMRARGAQLTDLAIIIVAADDAVMPQTVEAINHAQAANVPMVFAINKIDKPGADSDKIRRQLSEMNILVEDWGGKYQCQEISAKKGLNVDKLLEKVLLETDLLELKANPNKLASGAVIESSLDKGRGYLATVLVQDGTLRQGDCVLCGSYYGRVKSMFNERGQKVSEAGPATPVSILGLNGAPAAGEKFNVLTDEREAKNVANKREQLLRIQGIKTQKHMTLEEIGRRIAIGNFKELNIIVKGDVDGSVEALSDSLIKLSTEEVKVNVIHKAVGGISESDVLLAEASDAVIVGFQVRPTTEARRAADRDGIEIRLYSVIYDCINEVKDGIEGMLEPEKKEEVIATAEIKQTFRISKVGTIAGCIIRDGKMVQKSKVRLIRDGIVIYTGELGSLQIGKDQAKEVTSGKECGMSIAGYNDIKEGDIIEAFQIVEIKRTL
ncbi:MAG: translation initiation factor IF-2 [Bacteroidales bacterium]|nr:translation initiation factor IF-2 [Bacteroidales bacterium]